MRPLVAASDARSSDTQARRGPSPAADSGAGQTAVSLESAGRRILSTAFVRVGPDGYLTLDLRDGTTMVLRDVRMGAQDYCGVEASGARRCGNYADISGARPGGGPVPGRPDPVTSDRPAQPQGPAG